MSQFVTTQFGRFRRVTDGNKSWFLWECPECYRWASLSENQWHGLVSVQCGDGKHNCTYHETHDFSKELIVVMQARILVGDSPIDLENEDAITR